MDLLVGSEAILGVGGGEGDFHIVSVSISILGNKGMDIATAMIRFMHG